MTAPKAGTHNSAPELRLGDFLVDEARSFGAGALDGEQLRKALANRAVGKSGSGIRDWMASRWENAPGRFGAHMAGYAEGRLESLAWVRDADVRWTPSADDAFGAFSIGGVGGTHTGTDSFFGIQPKIRRDGFGDLSGTFGVFQRRALGDWGVVGVNAFADYKGEARGTFSRYWLGADFASAWVDADVKRYFGGDGRTFRRDGKLFRAYTPDGVTGELRIHSPGLRWLEGKATFAEWQGRGGNADRRSQSFGVDYIPAAGWRFGADYDGEHAGADFGFAWALGVESQLGAAEPFNVYSDLAESVREDGTFDVFAYQLHETAQLFEWYDAGLLTLSAEAISVAMSLTWDLVPEHLRIDPELRGLCTPPIYAVNNRVATEKPKAYWVIDRYAPPVVPGESYTYVDTRLGDPIYDVGDIDPGDAAINHDLLNAVDKKQSLVFARILPDGMADVYYITSVIAGSRHTCLNVLWGVDPNDYKNYDASVDINLVKSLVLANVNLYKWLNQMDDEWSDNPDSVLPTARIIASTFGRCLEHERGAPGSGICEICRQGFYGCPVCEDADDPACKFTYPADWEEYRHSEHRPSPGWMDPIQSQIIAAGYTGEIFKHRAWTGHVDVDFSVSDSLGALSVTIAGGFDTFTLSDGVTEGRRNYTDGWDTAVVHLTKPLAKGEVLTGTLSARFFYHTNERNIASQPFTISVQSIESASTVQVHEEWIGKIFELDQPDAPTINYVKDGGDPELFVYPDGYVKITAQASAGRTLTLIASAISSEANISLRSTLFAEIYAATREEELRDNCDIPADINEIRDIGRCQTVFCRRFDAPLSEAIASGDAIGVCQAIRNGANVHFANAFENQYGPQVPYDFPLAVAARNNRVDIGKVLVRNGANVHQTLWHYGNAMNYAATGSAVEFARWLQSQGVSPTAGSGSRNRTPAQVFLTRSIDENRGEPEAFAAFLLSTGLDPNEPIIGGQRPINVITWSANGNAGGLRTFLEAGLDPHLERVGGISTGYSPLMYAAIYNFVDVVRVLADETRGGARMSVNYRHPFNGYQAIHYARSDEVVRLLHQMGADVNSQTNPIDEHSGGWTPLDRVLRAIRSAVSRVGGDYDRRNQYVDRRDNLIAAMRRLRQLGAKCNLTELKNPDYLEFCDSE